MHPVRHSTHGSSFNPDDKTSQSKINHYSPDQDYIVLNSDLNRKRHPITNLDYVEKKPHTLLELANYRGQWSMINN